MSLKLNHWICRWRRIITDWRGLRCSITLLWWSLRYSITLLRWSLGCNSISLLRWCLRCNSIILLRWWSLLRLKGGGKKCKISVKKILYFQGQKNASAYRWRWSLGYLIILWRWSSLRNSSIMLHWWCLG